MICLMSVSESAISHPFLAKFHTIVLFSAEVRICTKVERATLFFASSLLILSARLHDSREYLARSTECNMKRLGISAFLILLL